MRTSVPGFAVTKMADVSLDELIRRRNFNARGGLKRPTFGRGAGLTGRGAGSVGRGAGLMGRTFDARQKIGTTDVRQRLGGSGAFQVKDAREKLGQKDARFRIQARGGAVSAVQDARQTINSRKQQQVLDSPLVTTSQTAIPHIHIHNNNPSSTGVRSFPTIQGLGSRVGVAIQPRGGITKVVDARDRLSLKRSVSSLPSQGSANPLKITKTIQQRPVGMTSGIRINVPSRATQSASNEEEEEPVVPNKQLKFTTTNDLAPTRVGGGFSVSTPITKVVKNDSYLAPPPAASAAAAVAPTRSNPRPPAQTPENTSSQPAQPVFSPLEGTKITVNNLHPRVTEEDIVELFCVCGALKRARLVKVGVAEVVFVRKDDAISAYRKYNNRCLDGQPMKCNLHIQGSIITSDQPILLRLSDSPGKKETPSSTVSRSTPRSSSAEVDPQTILKALFKSSNQSSATTETPPPAANSTAFRIKI
ncbi:polymerase delta-interacting protein 3 isoform X2 [Ictalurus punctatus]|uniref:Polymerase delta-interacting protein 3 isoform X2 n=1 Tax=Ictalurus punctatus TaxID=7998 RepID=A0A2D0S102_ICTPU|nr:polymerase delta-interacting protein 3 isoform X2 [Ictalurus punctatus]